MPLPPHFAANLDWLYPDLAYLDRIAAARADGFGRVEMLFAHQHDRALLLARLAGAPVLHLMSGIAEDDARTRATWLANLAWAAAQAPAGLTLTVEPINHRDMPGYFLHRQAQALELLSRLASPRVKLQLDLYHCRIAEDGESLSHLTQALDLGLLDHVQLAGVNGRHEPGVDEYAAELALLAERGWQGAIGLEYKPRGERGDRRCAGLKDGEVPLTECLKDTVARVLPRSGTRPSRRRSRAASACSSPPTATASAHWSSTWTASPTTPSWASTPPTASRWSTSWTPTSSPRPASPIPRALHANVGLVAQPG